MREPVTRLQAKKPKAKKTARKPAQKMDVDEASATIKRYAAKQPVTLNINAEQLDQIISQWDRGDPKRPTEITFQVDGMDRIKLRVAGYWYRGDTCCV